MSRQMIPYLIKFFSLEAHADQFIADNLFMNRLSHFRKLEGRDDSRSDANEAIAMWWQPHDIIVTLSVPGIGDTTITKDHLFGLKLW